MSDLYPGFSRCVDCGRRDPKRLVGGVCPRCWKAASARIRKRLAFQAPMELRYNTFGHIKTMWGNRVKEHLLIERDENSPDSLIPVGSVA